MNWRDLECQTINPSICNSLYRHLFLIYHYCLFCVICVLWLHIGTFIRLLAAEPRGTALLLFHCRYLFGTILATPYSMVWDWRVSRAVPMPFIGLATRSCFSPIDFLFSSFILWVVLWGWGLRTDRTLITLSQPCTINLF